MLRRVANWVEAVVGVALLLTVILLFANQPAKPPDAQAEVVEAGVGLTEQPSSARDAPAATAAMAPAASGHHSPAVVSSNSSPTPPIRSRWSRVVAPAMPSFAAKLTEDEIAAVVEYTRTILAGG